MASFRDMTENQVFTKGSIEKDYYKLRGDLQKLADQYTDCGTCNFQRIFSVEKEHAQFGSKSITFNNLLKRNKQAFEKVLENFNRKEFTLRYCANSWNSDVIMQYEMTHGKRVVPLEASETDFIRAAHDSFDTNATPLMDGRPNRGMWVPDPWNTNEVSSSIDFGQKATFKNYVTFRIFQECGDSYFADRAQAVRLFLHNYSLEEYEADMIKRVIVEVRKVVDKTGIPIVQVIEVLNNEFSTHVLKTALET